MSKGESRWGKPPPGYIPGLGRGAVGFNTRSDIGPARNVAPKEYNKIINTRSGMFQEKKQQDGMGNQSAPSESENDQRDYSESNFNKWNGYEENLFTSTDYDEEDREADFQYNMIDQYMDERRKSRKEKNELEMLMKIRNEKPTIRQSFSDIKHEMKKLSKDDWEKIPDIQDFTVKKRKIERYTPNTDVNIERALNDSQLANSISNSQFGAETPIGQYLKGTDTISSNILNEVGKAKNSVLSVAFDKMSDKVSGMNSVNPLGYLTEMSSVVKVNSANEVQDFKKARVILNSILNTDKNNVGGWIAAARLEELDGKLAQARNIIAQAGQNILDSEDIWLEAARLHPPDEAKIILAKGISHLPNSRKLWLAAADIERDKSKKSKILRKALENLPTEEEIWKRAIEIENEEEAKLLLYRAVECIPHNVDMWLALARLENYNKARAVLNKARKALPTEHTIWVHAVKLEEAQNYENCKSDELIERGIKTLAKNGKIVPKEIWEKEAEICEASGSMKTCAGIIKAIIKIDLSQNESQVENLKNSDKTENSQIVLTEEKKSEWLEMAENAKHNGCIETFRNIYDNLLIYDPEDIELWMNRIQFEKNYGNEKSQEETLKRAVNAFPTNEILWLMYAKHKWQTESVEAAKNLLDKASLTHPKNEQIILATVKLHREDNDYQEAERVLSKAREEINTPRVWMQSIQLLREQNKLEEASDMVNVALSKFRFYPKLWMIAAQLKEEQSDDMPEEIRREYVEEAVKIYEKGIENNKKSDTLYFLLSKLLHDKLHREAVARRVLELGLKSLPLNDKIWYEFIRFENKCKNYSNANLILSKGLKEMPNSGLLWSLAIESEKPHLRHSRAADALSKVENNEYIMTSIAKVYLLDRNIEKARKWFENSLRINSDFGDTWIYYYKMEIEMGEENKAEEIVKRCVEKAPRHGEIWTSICKKVENWKLKTKDILLKAVESISLDKVLE
jgi:pre-mRNA-processing factor 6